MARDVLNVTVKLDHIHCFDESDGAGDAEPYLWTVFFRVDGSNTFVTSGGTVSNPAIWTTPGSHGNLGTKDVDAGQDVPVPSAIGLYKSTLLPIVLPNVGDVGGVIGCVCVLMEEDNVSDDGAEAGHQALNNAVRDVVTQVVTSGNTDISEADIQALVDGISDKVSQAVKNQQGLFSNLWAGLDPDDTIGAKVFLFTHDDLAKKGTIPFDQRWTGSDGDWQIFGNATATVLCPASAFSKSSSSAAGGTATDDARFDQALSVMREFREKEWREQPGLHGWWELAERHVSELALVAARDPQVLDAATQLLTAMPDILGRRDQPLPPEFLRNAEIVLQSLRTSGSRKARLDASRAVWALRQLGEKSFDQAIEFLAVNRPARHPRAR